MRGTCKTQGKVGKLVQNFSYKTLKKRPLEKCIVDGRIILKRV